MNKTAIKNFAIWARNKLIADVQYRAGLMGITEKDIQNPLPQSTSNVEFYDIGTAEPYSIAGHAIQQRKRLVHIIRQKEKDSDYPPPTSTSWKKSPTPGSTASLPSASWKSTITCPLTSGCCPPRAARWSPTW